MVKIDAHHHLWEYAPKIHDWIDNSMGLLKRDFLPEHLYGEMQSATYNGCVAIQASQTEEETDFLIREAAKYPFIKGVVGWFDLRDPLFDEKLEHYRKSTILKGLRHVVQDEPDEKFLLDKDFMRGISLLEKYNLTYDILIFPRHLKVASEFVQYFPKQKFVLDHIAKPTIKKSVISPWKEDILQLAKYENVYCKVSGMVTGADWNLWKYEDIIPYLDVVFEAFGIDRLMIGSDWPVCKLAGSYKEIMGIVENYLSDDHAKEKVLGRNAIEFYSL